MFIAIGVGLLAAVFLDAFVTIFSTRGAGPLTGFWLAGARKVCLALHRRWPRQRLLAYVGPALTLTSLVAWYALLVAGWTFIFVQTDSAVLHSQTGEPARRWLEQLYFVGSTTSGLGYGDRTPSRFPWTFVSGIAAFSATVIVTTSLSYVMAVLQAAVDRKTLAQSVFSLGTSAAEVQKTALSESNWLESHLSALATAINAHAFRHLAYPVLHQFYSVDPHREPANAILVLADAIWLWRCGQREPGEREPGLLVLLNGAIDNFIRMTETGGGPGVDADAPEFRRASAQTLCGADVPPAGLREAFAAYLPRRARLCALRRQAGWSDPA